MKLSDNAVAQLVRLFQVGLLTGTDISDNFRTLELVQNGDKLDPDPEYLKNFEASIEKMQEEAEFLNSQNKGFSSAFTVPGKKAN